MNTNEKDEIEVEIARARRDEANATKARADAEKAQEEVRHERAKTEKTKAETSNAERKVWVDVLEGVASLGMLAISIAGFFGQRKSRTCAT